MFTIQSLQVGCLQNASPTHRIFTRLFVLSEGPGHLIQSFSANCQHVSARGAAVSWFPVHEYCTIRQARQAGRPAAEGSGICKLLLCCPLGPVCGDTATPPHLCLEMGEKQSGSDQSTNNSSQYIASINCIFLLLLTACISINVLLFGLVRLWCTPLYLLWFKLKGNQVSSKMTAYSMGAERKPICLHECR